MTPTRRWLILGAIILAVETLYVFVVSAGKFVDWPSYLSYFDFLAEGFRSGHLHLSVAPDPELVAQSDPFCGPRTPATTRASITSTGDPFRRCSSPR
jgi:hypothetical protein